MNTDQNAEQPRTVTLEPHYPAIYQRFSREIIPACKQVIQRIEQRTQARFSNSTITTDRAYGADLLRQLNSLLAGIALATASVSNTKELADLRVLLNEALSLSNIASTRAQDD